MILILSIDFETSTDIIEEWLNFYGASYKRVNSSFYMNSLCDINPFEDRIEFSTGEVIHPSMINVVYNRRWSPNFYLRYRAEMNEAKNLNVLDFIKAENQEFGRYFKSRFLSAKWIDNEPNSLVTKIDQLVVAASCGMKVPKTIICNSKDSLIRFMELNGRAITKPIGAQFHQKIDGEGYSTYTEEITAFFLDSLGEKFHPSLFQEYIDKKFEIRSFYLGGKFYSLAYFSQEQKETTIDWKRTNYTVDFKKELIELPKEVKEKLKLFMKKLGLITGSFDLIFTKQDEFVLLEVNPFGIYEDVSYYGNFNIEKEFAKLLIKYDNTRDKRKHKFIG